MAHGRSAAGKDYIAMLSGRYKEQDSAAFDPLKGKKLGGYQPPPPGKIQTQFRTEDVTYSFSQEEELKRDGRTVYKTKEEKSFNARPKPWPGDQRRLAPMSKVSKSVFKASSDGKPQQMSGVFAVENGNVPTGKQQQQDYHYQQTSTVTKQYGGGAGPGTSFLPQQRQQQQTVQIRQQQQQQQPVQVRQQQQTLQIQQQQQQQPVQVRQQSQTVQIQQQQPQSPVQVRQQQQTVQIRQQQQQPVQVRQQITVTKTQTQQPLHVQVQGGPAPQRPGGAQAPQPPAPKVVTLQLKQPPSARPQQVPAQQGVAYAPQPAPAQRQQPISVRGQEIPTQQGVAYQAFQPQPAPAQRQQQISVQQGVAYQQYQPQPAPAQRQQPISVQQGVAYQPYQPQSAPAQRQQPISVQQGGAYQPQPGAPQRQQQPISGQQGVAYQAYQPQPAPAQRQQPVSMQRQEVSTTQSVAYTEGPQAGQGAAPFPWEEEPEQGVHENEPEQRPDLVREADTDRTAGLPSAGIAQNLRYKFLTGQVENRSQQFRKELTPPDRSGGGVFENQPSYNPDVVHYGEETQYEALPEQGTARRMSYRFKQMEQQGGYPGRTPGQREITPDRTGGQVEYVSEPRGYLPKYEPQVQAGVFENEPVERPDVVKADLLPEEVVPARGAARYMTQHFRQMSVERPLGPPRGQREITPDYISKTEYVSEPSAYVEKYEGRPESGVFESQPVERPDVVKADQYELDILPERGTARNVTGHFRQLGQTRIYTSSVPGTFKEFTPPRETGSALQQSMGVYENTPDFNPHVVHHGEQDHDPLPSRGTTRSMTYHFRQLSSGDNTPWTPRDKKEFTPPMGESGVFENTPEQFIPDYNRRPESGVIESQPVVRLDVVRSGEPPRYEEELPDRGFARNLVSAWRQKESGENSRATPTGSGKPKEFTPPREEPRVMLQRQGPWTPKSPGGYGMTFGSVSPADLPGQYQPLAEASVFESEPVAREDVTREADTDWTEGMPRSETTKKMLAKFRHIQQQAATDTTSLPPMAQGRRAQDLRY